MAATTAAPKPAEPAPRNAPPRPAPPKPAPPKQAAPAHGGRGPLAMPAHVQDAIEGSFGVTLGALRVHTDPAAREAAEVISARAFTHGSDVVLGKGARADDLALMAHEAAHVVQQQGAHTAQAFSPGNDDRFEAEANRASAAVVRGEPFTVRERVSQPRPQRSILSRALHWIADHVDAIPGWRMFTILLGKNPITGDAVERSAANVLRAVVEFLPGGTMITEALDRYSVFDKAGAWIGEQISKLGDIGSSVMDALYEFIDGLHLSDVLHLGDVWDRAKRIFTVPIDKIIAFLKGLYDGIVKFVKDAILRPLAELASKTRAWDLLCAIMGKNPITGEPVPRNADTLIGGFMKLIGQEEVWNNLKKANAVARAWQWFQSAMAALVGFVSEIPGLFLAALRSLKLADILDPIGAFKRIAGIFGDFVGRFITWAGDAVWNLLEIIFDVVAPGAMPYLKKVGAALKWIFKHPIEFVHHLVNAGKAGFHQFAGNIGAHLKAAFIDWLTGSLTGIYVPKSFELGEIVKLLLSALNLTWQALRAKLVKIVGEPAVKAMETGFDIVVTLVRDGPAAAWEKIKDELSTLKDMVVQGIIDYVTTTIVKKAVEKIASMLVPGGAFVQAIISIYDTIMFFVHKLTKIIQVVTGFLDSMMEIASGAIMPAAKRIESTLAGMLSLAINFLANFLGLGKISDKIVEIIAKVRDKVDAALDKLVSWIVNAAKSLVGKGTPKETSAAASGDVRTRAAAELEARVSAEHTREEAVAIAAQIATEFQAQGLKSLEIGPEDEDGASTVFAEASPKLPLMSLIPRGVVPKGRSERLVALIELTPSAVPTPAYQVFAPAEASYTVPTGSLTAAPTAKQLAKAGVAPNPAVERVTAVSWNTTAGLQFNSAGHAEYEFLNWLQTQDSRDPTFLGRIESIRVELNPYSTCSPCSDIMSGALGLIKSARKGKPVAATLAWSKIYPGGRGGVTATTWQTLGTLSRAGWSLAGGEQPQEEGWFTKVFVKRL